MCLDIEEASDILASVAMTVLSTKQAGGSVFAFRNLDSRTRAYMLAELDRDIAEKDLYLSTRFSAKGIEDYPALVRLAIESGDEASLGAALEVDGRMLKKELRQGKEIDVRTDAAVVFAEGEFNRFYTRAICRRAFEDGTNEVEVYRAKEVATPRESSTRLLGARLPANTLLDDLRVNKGVDTALGLNGAGSGLSVFCPCDGCAA